MRIVNTARRRTIRLFGLYGLCSLVLVVQSTIASARQFELDFDGPETSWQVRCRQREAKLVSQERRRDGARRGQAEFIRVQSVVESTPLRIEHELPTVRVLDELTGSLWYRSDRPGATIAIRIAFRGSKDPETGATLTMLIMGDKYEEANKWQQLVCRTTEKAVNDQLRLLRFKKKVVLDPDTMYVDRIVLGMQLETGSTEMLVDDLEFGPLVPSESATSSTEKTVRVPVEFRLNKLQVEGKPFFPRAFPWRQEHCDVAAGACLNTAWVPDVDSITNSGQFRDRGIWLTATPPYAKGANGEPLDSGDAAILPFGPSSTSVLFWMLGARMSADSRPRLQSWADQIRDADRAFKRPLAADIADDEYLASKHLNLIGLSRHVVNSGLSLGNYRDEIIRRRDRALPRTFCFSWIQTEPAQELLNLKQTAHEVPVLEPEQIRLQVYAALAAGCRGIGYWTTTPLDSDVPGARERQLMMTQLNLELGLLEPWLATSSSVQLIPFTVDAPTTRSRSPFTNPLKKSAEANQKAERELSAALIRSEFGMLVLPMWLDDNSQYVPAQLAAHTATVVVPGGGDTATAWLITTTGRIQNLTRETIAGGIRIVLPKFDQTAAILVTSDPSIRDQIDQRIAVIQERSANVTVELCRLKLDRVRRIDQQLQQLGVGQPDARALLGKAKLHYDMAEAKLKQQEYHAARQYADIALQFARILQRAHWDHAVAKRSTPLASPYTLCFQTLPAHWRLVQAADKLGSKTETNKLPSGEFEDLDTLIAGGWRHEQRSIPDVQVAAELFPEGKQGKSALRLAVNSTAANPATFQFHVPPVSLTSPPVTVYAGQLVKFSGWVKATHPIIRSVDGLMIYDSLLGKTGALRFTDAKDWQRFEVWRVVPESRSMTITAEMHGFGEILLDDFRVTIETLADEIAEEHRTVESEVKPAKFSPLDPFDLRRFTPLRDRK